MLALSFLSRGHSYCNFIQEYSRFAPGVYVCGHEMANRLDGVRALGITAVVNVAAECFPCPFEAEGMQYAAFSVNDSPNEDVTCLFHTVIEVTAPPLSSTQSSAASSAESSCDTLQIIEAVASAGGATLIHCQYGVSRSASFGIAYLMWRFGLSCADGIAAAVNARGCVNPNPGFVAQLLEWEKLIPQLPGRSTAGVRP